MTSSLTSVTAQVPMSSSSSSLPSNPSSSLSTASALPPLHSVIAAESSPPTKSLPLPSFSPSLPSSKSSPPPSGNRFSTMAPPPAQASSPSQLIARIAVTIPSAPSSNSKSNSPEDKYNRRVNVLFIAGVAVGVALFLVIMTIVCICCWKRKKKAHNSMQYYADPSARKDSMYYTSGVTQKWHNVHQARDHVVQVQPPHDMHAQPGGGWHLQPPSTLMSSTEISSLFSSQQGPPLSSPSPTLASGFNKSTFTYEELETATNNFSQANLLGQGGFGYVHKGLLPNGKEIAVKSLKLGSGQGEREFQAEVDIISRVHHRHLLSLVGYCISGSQRMLVYDFIPNRTLEYHLHGKGLPVMDLSTRLKIAIGSAKGIAYLHEDCHPRIIHRDIKSANILLDFNFEAMFPVYFITYHLR